MHLRILIPTCSTGMKVKSFQGVHDIQEVECSGHLLAPYTEVLMMSIFESSSGKELAFVNVGKRECLTYGMFSSCLIDDRNSQKTILKTLVLSAPEGTSRWYGCNLTAIKSGRDVSVIRWSIDARRQSEY